MDRNKPENFPKDFINALALNLSKQDFADLVRFYEAIGDEKSADRFRESL